MRASSLLTTLSFFFLVPGEVTFVNVSNITQFGFTITWGRPAYENGDLRNYSAILSNANGTIKERMDVNISTEKVSFYKLNPGWYHVNINFISNTNVNLIADSVHFHFLIFRRCMLQCDYRCC